MGKLLNVAVMGLSLMSCGEPMTDKVCQKTTKSTFGFAEGHGRDRAVDGACLDGQFEDLDDMRDKCRGGISKLYGSDRTTWICDKKCFPEYDFVERESHEPGWSSCDDAEER